MWWLNLQGRYSKRPLRWFLLLLTGLLAGLFLTLSLTFQVWAADAKWGGWTGRDIVYNNQNFVRSVDGKKAKQLNLSENAFIYLPKNENNSGGEVNVIYFTSDTDITSLSQVNYATYEFSPPNNYTLKNTSTISIDPPSENNANTSCDLQGIGWIVCPLANNIASGMDTMYEILTNFLETKPLESTNKSGIYVAWNIMRNFANVVFIIVFLIIIYSQITSVGVSNYGIKKLVPRLIIAALLVNLSFIVCAVLLDISNTLGYAIQDMFVEVRKATATIGKVHDVPTNWTDVTATILSNGSNGAVIGGAAIALNMGTELLPMLAPILVGAGLAILLALLIMAARQALIMILVIISPLAFVCYLLPGTEEWFEKWKKSFMTMLIFFPAFALIFGGSQLAGMLIIQNATGSNGTVMHLIGMAVQVAPLWLTPLMLKLGGGLLNRFAGIVNDKNKGLFDKTKNWANDMRSIRKNQKLSSDKNRGKRHVLANARRKMDEMSRKRKQQVEDYQKRAQASYEASRIGKKQAMFSKRVADEAGLAAAEADSLYGEMKAGRSPVIDQSATEKLGRRLSASYSSKKDLEMQRQADKVRSLSEKLAIEGMRKSNAQRAQNKQLAEAILNNPEYQRQAAGNVYLDGNGNNLGMDAALATAISTTRKETAQSIEEADAVMKHYKLTSSQRQALATGGSVQLANGTILDNTNTYITEAAIAEQARVGTVKEVAELVTKSPTEFRESLSSALASSSVKNKAPFMGGKLIEDVFKGAVYDEDTFNKYVAEWIQEGKFKPEDIAITDAYGINILKEALLSNHGGIVDSKHIEALKKAIDVSLTGKELSRHVTEAARNGFNDLMSIL